MNDHEWLKDAACVGEDPELWFADEHSRNAEVEKAVRICNGCPVAGQCLTDTPPDDKFSIRGGLTPAQRTRRAA